MLSCFQVSGLSHRHARAVEATNVTWAAGSSVPIRLLGGRRARFEHAVAGALHAVDQRAWFIEPVALEVLLAGKEI